MGQIIWHLGLFPMFIQVKAAILHLSWAMAGHSPQQLALGGRA